MGYVLHHRVKFLKKFLSIIMIVGISKRHALYY